MSDAKAKSPLFELVWLPDHTHRCNGPGSQAIQLPSSLPAVSAELALPMGDIPMDGISVADIGAVVSRIFDSPGEFLGKAMGLSAEALTVQQYADVLSKILGKDIRDAKITLEAYEKLRIPDVEEMANMFRFYQMKPARDVKLTHRLNPEVKSFSQFVSENKEALMGI